ncbi:MAG: glycosyltransferase [Lachnospiraceae bacterium]|nr:glycosyltransferase [Lachnospiraceae bacterium]
MSKHLVLIGPVYPYKSGIAHYTGLLHRALSAEYDTRLISYKMQYPKLLFRKEQKDYSSDAFKAENAEFLINTANPINILNTASDIIKRKPDAVIIEWWHPYFAPCYCILTGRLRKAGIKILFLCHNVFPHERFVLDRFLTRRTLSRGDCFVLHSREEASDLLSIKSDASYRINPHPTYQAFNLSGLKQEEARELLGLKNDAKMILFFGFIRDYKGLKHLIRALSVLRDKGSALISEGFKLYIVGDFSGPEDRERYISLIEEEKVASYIEIVDGYVPDNEVEKYFAACDLVVLPYESATQSGIIQIAFGFEKPVIATRVGGLPDAVDDGVTGILVEPGDPGALAGAIETAYDRGMEGFTENIRASKYKFSWERMVRTIGELL